MPQKNPGTSYSGKPVRKLRLPKIGPTKTKSLFEEYFYVFLAILFFSVSILGKAGGLSAYNALVVGAWMTAFLWFARQWKGYFAEKSKAKNEKIPGPQVETRAGPPKGPLPLPSGMKPMIGPQWPVKPGSRPAWPRLPKERREPASEARGSQSSPVQTSGAQPSNQTPVTASDEKTRSFVYERPTLPDRKPKLPNNWANPTNKKLESKNLNNKKPKQ